LQILKNKKNVTFFIKKTSEKEFDKLTFATVSLSKNEIGQSKKFD
jgi:hypothetical protein